MTTTATHTVLVERYASYSASSRIAWAYRYRIDGGILRQAGSDLTSLMTELRREFAPWEIVETW